MPDANTDNSACLALFAIAMVAYLVIQMIGHALDPEEDDDRFKPK